MRRGRLFCKHVIQKEIQGKFSAPTKTFVCVCDADAILNRFIKLTQFFIIFFIIFPCCRFCLQIKPGGLIRVHTSVLQATSLYKSLFISEETTSDELLALLLSCFNLTDPVEQYSLYEVNRLLESSFGGNHIFNLFALTSLFTIFSPI